MKILFVCRGNICRSPTAEGVLLSLLKRAGLSDTHSVDSAALMDWHIGKAPDPRSINAAAKEGVDISAQKARQLVAEDFKIFDAIYVMDDLNVQYIKENFGDQVGKLELLTQVLGESGIEEVPDPYDGTEADFDATFSLINRCCEALFERYFFSLK